MRPTQKMTGDVPETPNGQNMAILQMAAGPPKAKILTFVKIDIEGCIIAQMKGFDA